MFRVNTLIMFKIWFAVFLTSQHSWISAIKPCTKILWINRTTQSKACCSVTAKGKIEKHGIGALLLPSSSMQNHEPTIDHISIMKLSPFWSISPRPMSQPFRSSKMDTGIVEEMPVLILSQAAYTETGYRCARNTSLDVLRWFPSEV